MTSERKKKLLETVKQFNKLHKSKVFSMGSEIQDLPVIPSGIKKIDDFIGGGFKNGGHTIIWGTYSVGKTALVLTAIANAQKEGKLVCYVNTEKPLELERFKFFGIKLDDMLYIEAPENAEKALEAMRTLCKNKVIDLFVIDSTNGLCPKSVQEEKTGKERSLEKKNIASLPLILSNFYNIVSAHIFRSRASIIWIGQGRTQGIGTFFTRLGLSGGMAQEFYAYQIIFMRKGQGGDAPMKSIKRYFLDPDKNLRYKTEKVAVGFDVVMKLIKTNSCKSALENSELHIPFVYKEGFVDNFDSESQEIEISGTEEEKEIIKKMLTEKGILIDTPSKKNLDKAIKSIEKDFDRIVNTKLTEGKTKTNTKEPKNTPPPIKPPDVDKRKNKIFDMVEEDIEAIGKIKDVSKSLKKLKELKKKSGRGRPKGSKNKEKK